MLTPYTINKITPSTLSEKRVKWILRDQRDVAVTEECIHSVINEEHGEFQSSLITCKHPEGKVWESLFIATSRNGMSGLAITWWGKAGSRGQVSIKKVGEADWYTVVKSKVVGKGYEINAFIGRDRALMNSHQFVTDIHESSPSLPAMGFPAWVAQDIIDTKTMRGLGDVMGRAFSGIVPVSNFITKLLHNGHNVPEKINEAASAESVTAIKDTLSGVAAAITSSSQAFADVLAKAKAPKLPDIDREEVYAEAWGGFA